ncbi:MAG: hypothetical protein R3C42_05440 [Parvularculaceae bacterium]
MIVRRFFGPVRFSACCRGGGKRITNFDVSIDAQKDGDILVTERIDVLSEWLSDPARRIPDLPRAHLKDGRTLAHRYDVKSVQRTGARNLRD